MQEKQNRGLTLMSLVIIIIIIVLVIAVIMVLYNSVGKKETIKTSRDVLPGKTLYYLVENYGLLAQTEDKTLYISQKEDVKVGNKLIFKKDEFCKVQKCKDNIVSIKDITLISGYQTWFVAYEDGTVEKIDIIQDVSRIKESPFETTPLPEYNNIISFWSITRDGVLEVNAKNSTGENFIIYTMKVD